MILASLKHATRTVLARDFEDEFLLAAVGGGGLREQMRALDAGQAEALVRCYREHNEPLHEDLEACNGVVNVLDRLVEEGRRLGLVTAKRQRTVALAERALPLTRYFDVVVTIADTEQHKPNPDPILVALERLRAAPEEAAYVGDSPFDVCAAKAAGVGAVAVTWGGIHPAERLTAEEPDALVDTPEELLGVL